MVQLIDQVNVFTGLFTFLVFTLVGSLIIYRVSANYLQQNLTKDHERAGRVLFRISASLLALVLSLTFANQRVGYFKVKANLEDEASKLVDVHFALGMINTPEALELQKDVRVYIGKIMKEGWVPLYNTPFESEQFKLFKNLYKSVTNLQVSDEKDIRLKNNILEDLDIASDLWQLRAYSTISSSTPLLYTCFLGLVITMVLFGINKPDKKVMLMGACYVIFAGTILYFILAMGNPLRGPLKLDAGPFKVLQETIDKNFEDN